MTTKTTKKPRARKPRTRAYSKEYTELRTELIRYINDRHSVLSGEMLTLRDNIRELVLGDAKVHINRHCGLGHEGLRVYIDKKIAEAEKLLGERLSDGVSAHVALTNEVESLNERLCDEVNKGHGLHRRVGELEQELRRALTIEDLRKTNVTISLMEKDIQEIEKKREHDAGAFNLLVPRVDRLEQRLNGEKESDAIICTKLRHAKELIASGYWCTGVDAGPGAFSAIGALKHVADGQPLHEAVIELYCAVDYAWGITGKTSEMTLEQRIQLLNEWNDGMATCKEDVLLAFDIAIKRSSR